MKQDERKRLEKLDKKIGGRYPRPVYFDERKGRLVRLWKSKASKRYRHCKKAARRRFRRFAKRNGGVPSKYSVDVRWDSF